MVLQMNEVFGCYMDPETANAASLDESVKTLESVAAIMIQLALEKKNLRAELNSTDDEDVMGEIGQELKMIRSEESSWQRIASCLQSIIKVP